MAEDWGAVELTHGCPPGGMSDSIAVSLLGRAVVVATAGGRRYAGIARSIHLQEGVPVLHLSGLTRMCNVRLSRITAWGFLRP